ncbi:MAG: hypothetical protein PVJ86_14295 [Phycisphaerales bacterium]|jgi:hypothetical protein
MTKTRTKTTAGLVLLAGVILTTGTVWGKAEKTPLPEVEFTYTGTPGPETRIWTTDGGIQHIRRLPYELTGVGDGLTITITGVCNHNRSLNTLDGNFWGHDQTVELTWGELTGTFRGTHSGKTIDWVGYSSHVYYGSGGDFEGMKLTLGGIFDYATKSGVFSGTIMVAGAIDGEAVTASAKVTKDSLPEVEFTYIGTLGPETRIWTNDGGIQHIRRLPYELTGVGDGMTIAITGTCNHSRSLETLDGNFWGDDHTVEVTWNGLTGTFRGRHTGKTIDWVGYSTHVYHGISGDFDGMKLMLDGIFDYATKSGVLEGILQGPPGE